MRGKGSFRLVSGWEALVSDCLCQFWVVSAGYCFLVITAMRVPHPNFVVVTPIIMKFGTGVKLDVFYTMVAKNL